MTVLTPQELQSLRQKAQDSSKQRRRQAAMKLIASIGVGRPTLIGQIDQLIQSDLDERDYTLSRKLNIATGGNYVTFTADANKLKLFSNLARGSQPSQQDAGQLVVYDRLRVMIGTTIKRATQQELLDKLGLRITYNDGRDAYEMPIRNLLSTGLRSPDAGNNAGTVVAGNQTEVIELGKELRLEAEDFIIVAPGDTQFNVELFWLSDYATSPPASPAGSDTTVDLHVVASGKLFKAIKRQVA